MFSQEKIREDNKENFYKTLCVQMKSVLEDENDFIANMANFSAVLFWQLKDINWCGFYLLRDNQLVLGPFQGKPACTRIQVGVGVCGTAVATNNVQLVDNVHEFHSHIACDADTNSEIVIPIYSKGECIGVLDIDSPIFSRFDEIDKKYLKQMCELITK